MKKLRTAAMLILVLATGAVLAACSGKNMSAKNDMAVPAVQYDYKESSVTQDAGSTGLTSTSGLTDASGWVPGSTDGLSMEKIITKVNLEVETQEFDDLIATVKDNIAKLGGYEEKAEISGKRYYSRNSSRHAYIVARIPRERLKEFVYAVRENANVVNESSTSENVTLQYVDTQSRKKALEIEQERLFSLLEKTESMEDIVTLESRLSSIRHELQMYETELRTIDNQVEYSTVSLSIYEVERMTPTEETETISVRIKNGFSRTIYDISEGFKNFVVWFVVNLPYIAIWAVVVTAGILILRKLYKKIAIYNKKGKSLGIGEKLLAKEPENPDKKSAE